MSYYNKPKLPNNKEKLEYIKHFFKEYLDFPKAGDFYRDIFSITKNPKAFNYLVDLLKHHIATIPKVPGIIVGLDPQGFLLGTHIAMHFNVPFVPIRDKGKLPGSTLKMTYETRCNYEEMEIQTYALHFGKSAIIVDDLLMRGETMSTACELVKRSGVEVQECLVVIEFTNFKARDKINAPVHSLLQY